MAKLTFAHASDRGVVIIVGEIEGAGADGRFERRQLAPFAGTRPEPGKTGIFI